MKTFKTVCFISAILTTLSSHASSSSASTPIISISPLDKDHIKVEYTLPKQQSTIELTKPYGDRTLSLRHHWQPLNNCGSLSNDGFIIQNEKCKSVSFSVPIDATFIDRVNPVAYPMGEEGVLVHTGIFTLNSANAIWKFASPKGSLIVNGVMHHKNVSIDQSKQLYITYVGVFLSYKKLAKNTHLITTNTVPDVLKNGINDGSKKITDYYNATYPLLNFAQPTIFINNVIGANNPGEQSDVSSRHIRFGFSNWDEARLPSTLQVVAHEFAHVLQPEITNDIANGPLITEGGAEFISWLAGYRLGWWDKNYLSVQFSQSLKTCIELSDGSPWKIAKNNIGNGGYGPYKCGWTIHTLALASRNNPESAEQTVEMYYANTKKDHNTDFARALECGSIKNCQASFLPTFFNSDTSVAEVVELQLNKLGLITHKDYAPKEESLSALGTKAFSHLMSEDCGGMIGFWTKADHMLTDNISQCKTFKKDLKVNRVEGVSYFSDALKAIEVQNQGCSNKHQVTVETLDNQKIIVPCTKIYTPQKNYFEIDIDKLLYLLEKH